MQDIAQGYYSEMKPILISLFEPHPLMKLLATKMDVEIGTLTLRDFPDGETYIKFDGSVENKSVIILNSLDHPNQKILPLLFAAKTARELGAKSVGLCAPYLAYMRQDKRFQSGEAITSNYFAALLSQYFDWMVTVDPHLHRHHRLSEIYTIPNTALHAASAISRWIINNVEKPILIGPDHESEQWVAEVAKEAHAPYLILEKIRQGDRAVDVSTPEIAPYLTHTPVLVDDIISTAQTMIATINHLKKVKMNSPICIGIHAVFADQSYDALLEAGAKQVVTCNTINHLSNKIDLSDIIVTGIADHLEVSILR